MLLDVEIPEKQSVKMIAIRAPEPLVRNFKFYADRQGTSITTLFKQMMQAYVTESQANGKPKQIKMGLD